MLAFRRFAARRSLPSRILSDNATTYLAASHELHELLLSPEVQELLAENKVTWTFIPKRAPWQGGFWERLIGITKTALKKTLGRTQVSFDQLRTILAEVEATLNDRPLTYVSPSNNDLTPLTPSHLISRRLLTPLPNSPIDDNELDKSVRGNHCTLNTRYQLLTSLQNEFWERWSSEYLSALRERHTFTADGGKHNTIN